jgi:hypothetical protein
MKLITGLPEKFTEWHLNSSPVFLICVVTVHVFSSCLDLHQYLQLVTASLIRPSSSLFHSLRIHHTATGHGVSQRRLSLNRSVLCNSVITRGYQLLNIKLCLYFKLYASLIPIPCMENIRETLHEVYKVITHFLQSIIKSAQLAKSIGDSNAHINLRPTVVNNFF